MRTQNVRTDTNYAASRMVRRYRDRFLRRRQAAVFLNVQFNCDIPGNVIAVSY